MHIRLSKRLAAIADMIPQGSRLCDVGCDHALVPLYLLTEKRIPSALAMDVAGGPLAAAQVNIERCGCEDRIETRLSDGLSAYNEGEADVLLISGMGGILIAEILGREPGKTASFRELIFGPQKEYACFRAYLRSCRLGIVEECMTEEDGKFYPLIRAVPGADTAVSGLPQPMEDRFGPDLLRKKDPVLLKYLLRRKQITEDILQSPLNTERLSEVREEMACIEAAIAFMEQNAGGC